MPVALVAQIRSTQRSDRFGEGGCVDPKLILIPLMRALGRVVRVPPMKTGSFFQTFRAR